MTQENVKQPSLADALIPILALIVMLAGSVFYFGDNSSYGPNQIVLMICTAIVVLIAIKNGHRWQTIEKAIVKGISMAMVAILILLLVGGLIGTWILAGIVPTMIYYGLNILSPDYFYVASCLICAVVAISIGSSWTVAGTIGISLIAMAGALGLSLEITAGAIISGAYFGDKMSPLSDTTNLAPAVTGTNLFDHIQHMTWTTIPSLIIAAILFLVIGLQADSSANLSDLDQTLAILQSQFNLSLWLLVPLLLVFAMAVKKVPAIATIFIGALLGGVFAVIFQSDKIITPADPELSSTSHVLTTVWTALFDGYQSSSGNAAIDDLLSRGGMSSMLNTIWLIITALSFGAVLELTGLLQKVVSSILSMVKSTGSLIASTVLTCIGCNILTADQYMAIVLPGRMYKVEFEKRGLDPRNLSRTLEDSATMTSALIPWNTCGAFMASTLGVATLAYLPFAFFNYLNPLISMIYGYTGFKLIPLEKGQTATESV